MSIQPDTWIKKMCEEHNMIEPFLDHQVSEGKISYGLSSMGYDVRISDEYRIFTNVNSSLVDPKNFSDDNFIERKGPYCIIPPNSFVLAKTIEYFRIPKDVLCICVGKSTYARIRAYVLLPTQIQSTSFGILKYSIVFAKTNEFGGIIQYGPFLSIKLSSEKFFGSTKELFTFVNILYSSDILTS